MRRSGFQLMISGLQIGVFCISIHVTTAQMSAVYELKSIPDHTLHLNGKGDNPFWREATVLTDFTYPWNEGHPPPMSFQGLHDRDYIYGLYKVHDPKKILVYQKNNTKRESLSSDRVEIFFRKDKKMENYYGLEMDPLCRVYDFEGHYPRRFTPDWSWPAGHLIIKAEITSSGYTLEFAISKKSLRKLGLLKGRQLDAGLYRGECVRLDGDKAAFKWISWIKPDSEKPDFHIPSSFGSLVLK